MAKKKTTKPGEFIEITRLQIKTVEINIKGKTPIIPHKWSEKSKRMMPGHPDRPKETVAKGKREPEKEADACLYKMAPERLAKPTTAGVKAMKAAAVDGSDERLGMPATAFKAALVGACRYFDEPSMTAAKQIFYVEGEGSDQLVEIKFKKKELHEDTPRNTSGTSDLRYRYYLLDWSATLRVQYVATIMQRESVVALLDAAGLGGVGDWRPSAPKSYTGTYGTWSVDESKGVRDVS